MILDRVLIMQRMIGICGMRVCVVKDATDTEILSACNSKNPSGTSNGWTTVVRSAENSFYKDGEGNPTDLPCQCDDYADREHLIVLC